MTEKILNGILGFVGAGLGVLFVFLLKDYFQSKWKKTEALETKSNTLELAIQSLTEEMKKNTKAMETSDKKIEALNETVKVLHKIEVDFGRMGSKLRRVARAVEKLTGGPLPSEELES